MTAKSAKPPRSRPHPTARVVIVVYPGVTLLDVSGPAQAFWSAREAAPDRAPYEIVLASASGSAVVTDTGVALGVVSLRKAAAQPIDTLLVAGGLGVFEACADKALVGWLRLHGRQARRAGSTCVGAFLAAAAGLHTGHRVATHWRWCGRLRRTHPDIEVDQDSVFLKQGRMWSAAGVTAGIDMALAMVEEDHGLDLALDVARSLVVFLKRPGGQSQFSAALRAQIADKDGRFDALNRWMSDNLRADLRVERLAERAGMSPRTFARAYTQQMGITPAKTVEKLRLEAARRLLERRTAPLAEIAGRCGFGDVERMRRAFVRALRITPSQYRRRFSMS